MNYFNPQSDIVSHAIRPLRTDDLTTPELLIVRSYRAWIKGMNETDSRPWNDVWNDFLGEFGTRDGKELLAWFARMINILRTHAERTVRYHQPGCPSLGQDERYFLNLVAACQNGEAMVARAQAEALVADSGVGDMLAAASQLAMALTKTQRWMPMRQADVIEIELCSMPSPSASIN